MLQVPGKTFLLGEYAVLDSGSALIAATSPSFEWQKLAIQDEYVPRKGLSVRSIHAESPAGLWLRRHNLNVTDYFLLDPYQGLGGFGASTAEFIFALHETGHLHGASADLWNILELYKTCATGQPSGADLVAQTVAALQQVGFVKVDLATQQVSQYMRWPFKSIGFELFHTGRKLATHTHLTTLAKMSFANLKQFVLQALKSFERNQSLEFLEAVRRVSDELIHLHLQSDWTIQATELARKKFPQWATKGCGAMGADVFVVFMPVDDRNLARDLGNKMGFTWIGNDLGETSY